MDGAKNRYGTSSTTLNSANWTILKCAIPNWIDGTAGRAAPGLDSKETPERKSSTEGPILPRNAGHRVSGRLGSRKPDLEPYRPVGRENHDGPLMRLDDGLGDGQPEAGAVARLVSLGIDPGEPGEQA